MRTVNRPVANLQTRPGTKRSQCKARQSSEASSHVVSHVTREIPLDALTDDVAARFWSKVKRTPTCWLWIGGYSGEGYPAFGIDSVMFGAHRVSFALHHGSPDGQLIRHLCGNRCCVNPEHLAAGTAADNAKDRAKHGRTIPGKPLTPGERKRLRQAIRRGTQIKPLMERFGVSRQTVSRYRRQLATQGAL